VFYRKKYEIATSEAGNPIKQDTKKGQLREVSTSALLLQFDSNLFSHHESTSSRKVTSSLTMVVFHKHGKILPTSTRTLMVVVETTIR